MATPPPPPPPPPPPLYKLRGSHDEARPCLMAAQLCGVAIELEPTDCPLALLVGGASSANPMEIIGKGAILRHIAGLESSQVDQWLELGSSGTPAGNSDKVLKILEERLAQRTFLASERLTVADVSVACMLSSIEADKLPTAVRRFYFTIMNQPQFSNHTVMPAIAQVDLEVVHEPENKAIAKLLELGLNQTTYAHALAMTVDEQLKEIGHLPGAKTKNLFLRDKKHGLFLITAAHDANTDTKTLAALLNLSGANLRFADSALLEEVLGVKQGSVGPLALVNDAEKKCSFVIDKSLLDSDVINSHPLRNDRTTAVSSADLVTFIKACGHEPVILDFSSAPAAPAGGGSNNKKEKAKQKASAAPPTEKRGIVKPKHDRAADSAKKEVKKETLLALNKSKTEDFPGWYQQVITYSEMIDYYDISGCYILRPWGYECWELIQRWFDDRIKELGVSNAYFPLFVSKKALEAEANHVEGFAPEVAWVTRSGNSELEEPVAVRPTSETIMYPAYARWIRSHRDLPLLLNQWSNVVRWEFKYPTPFLRSREFLWQEGHTAHVTFDEAEDMVFTILELYRCVYEEILAVPVIKGTKTELEKFAGGYRTTTVEAYITGSGRAIQGATSHNLGQNFGKMFNISFETAEGGSAIPWQTSWGITTRSIGVAVMCHGDDQGLVLPPRMAPRQVVIVPIVTKKVRFDDLQPFVDEILAVLKSQGVRVQYDSRTNYTSGWKYNHWEQKGVPIRLEVGPKDLEARQVVAVRRDEGSKEVMAFEDLKARVPALLEEIQSNLFEKAKKERDLHYSRVTKWEDFVPALNRNDIVLTPFCNETEWEEKVKVMSREEVMKGEQEDARTATSVAAKTLCMPLDQPELPPGTKCFVSGKPATVWVLWGRSY